MKKIFSILCVCAVAVSATAVPARRDGILRTAADGTEKTVYLHGNENFHYMTDAEGNWLDEETLAPMSEEAKALRLEAGRQRVARRAKQETGTSRLLAPRGAVILVSYADKAFSQTNADMTDWAMGDNYTYRNATGSIRKYFRDQSWGQYDMQIDVIGPVTVSQNLSYYGSNDGRGSDKHADELVVEACQLAAAAGADFSQYDSNNDGEVDWVVILYAGKGEADGGAANTIWPHQYDLAYTGKDFELNGKTINHYCCLNEIDGQTNKRCGIGTFCHEFSHVMGLPDFYATQDGATHHTLVDWDIMDYGPYNNGGNTPPCYSAYERWFMGWIEPRLINDASCSVVLPPLSDCRTACYMNAQGKAIEDILDPNPKTFYIFENRQQEGWDYYLPGEGMLITKITFSKSKWEGNTVNNYASSMGVDIIEAQTNTGKAGALTDVYPEGATQFTQITQYQVTNIVMGNRIVTFDVNGGGANIHLDVENVEGDKAQGTKVLRDGRLVIERGGKSYDVTGRLVD